MHSVSPAMHNAAFNATRMDAVYVPLAAADFPDFLSFADVMAIEGVSVTAPFKVDAFEHAAESDPVARRIQSANTLRRTRGRWTACNTDVAGFLAPLRPLMTLHGCRATILGAGGAARAAAEGLSSSGANVTIVARRRDAAARVAALTGASVPAWPPARASWDLVVNATPIGTAPALEDSPVPDTPLTGQLVYDLVYNPVETQLLKDARASGCQTLGGLDMLVAQAQQQFEWWTGTQPSERVLRDAALTALTSRQGERGR